MDGEVSRHGFKLNPNVSVVCPAPDIAPLASWTVVLVVAARRRAANALAFAVVERTAR
jgi:hypothetical protein